MPDNALVIPKFKDKTIYFRSGLGLESSYPVSASYKGILRLSPNDNATLAEEEVVEVLQGEDVDLFSYKDSIDDDLEKQFIRVSTSDGFLLDCRIGRFGAEFNNLYIIGPAKHERLTLFAKDEKSFVLDHTELPVLANSNATAAIDAETKMPKDIVANDSTNLAHILVSHNTSRREFDYEEIMQAIDDAILDYLLALQTEPVGSIHYFPISVKEYEKLLVKGRPNKFYCVNGEENRIKNSPIIRDYLLCDGSLYNNIDFPELAKILDGETIVYWDLDGKKNKYVPKTYVNEYSQNKYFRVPDLRRMFLRSVYPDLTKAGIDGNKIGEWEVDHRPAFTNNRVEDIHTHCITSSFITGNYKKENFENAVTVDAAGNLALTDVCSVLSPVGSNIFWQGDCIDADIYRCSASSRFYAYESMGYADYGLSVPKNFNYETINLSADTCLSSENISAVLPTPSADTDISYNDLDEYVPYLSQTKETYGMENAPEFFCGLPLIKI